MLDHDAWTYDVPFTNPSTGETRTIVVTLSRKEKLDALWNHAIGKQCAVIADASPITRMYASARTYPHVPEGFDVVSSAIERIRSPNVKALQ